MKFITDYKELHGNEEISIFDHISNTPIVGKSKILDYLRTKGRKKALRCAGIYDYIKDEPTFESIYVFTDEEYNWDSEEMYYFENYNVELNTEFVEKVLGK